MKKLYLFALAAMVFAACATDDTQDLQPMDAPETLTVGFEGGDDDTRVQLNSAGKTVWTKGDLVSVFYRSDANQKWQFQGETGERTGLLKRVSTPEATITLSDVVVAYPYSEEYYINPKTCNIQAYLPATQSYLKDSFGLDGNLMVSASEYNQIYLKNVCGWLKLQLTGNGEMVQSITLKGNNGEQVAGSIYVDTETATATLAAETNGGYEDGVGGTLVFDDAILTEVVLNCGNGVELGAEATTFYIALPPQMFEKGITVEIADTSGYTMTQSTDKSLAIERNTIQPMAAFKFINPDTPTQPNQANNEIWYTATAKVEPYFPDEFGATITSNVWDSETGKGVITFNANVTKIGYYAFSQCEQLKTITIPYSATSIGVRAFYKCPSLTNVTIPDSVTSIGDEAFRSCKSLTAFYGKFASEDNRCLIVNGTLNAFAIGCGATSYTIPDSVTKIGSYAFEDCTSLTSVTIPNSVTSIGNSAFEGCKSLTAFYGKFASEDNRCLIVNGTLNAFAIGCGATSYTIPDSVTKIGGNAFEGCTSLTSVTIPDSVTSIGNSAFIYCTSLKEVYCKPTTPPTGGSSMFSNNASGRKIFVPASDDNSIINAYKAKSGWSNYKSYIYEYIFIPNSEIWYTNGSTTVPTAPNETDVFGANIVSNLYDLDKKCWVITFDGDVTSIGKRAFRDCTSLTSITIPNSVTSIGNSAFRECTSLTAFYGKFASEDNRCLIVNGTLNAFAIGCGATSYTIPDSVTEIGKWAFSNCTSLTSVTIPNGVTLIGEGTFSYCTSLTSVTIPDSVTKIENFAFYDCTLLTSVNIPDSVTSIGRSAFLGCTSLTNITIPDSVTSIGRSAFLDCTSLTNITIPDSVTEIGEDAFYRCTSLKRVDITDLSAWCKISFDNNFANPVFYRAKLYINNTEVTNITIPSDITEIKSYAFYNCSSLTSVNIPDSVTSIGRSAFLGCTSLTNITIPDSVTSIGRSAFLDCTSLTSVTIPDSVTEIEQDAFFRCTSLKTVYCKPTTPPAGGSDIFYNNASGRKIYVPASDDDSIINAYKTAQYWSDYANYIEEYDFSAEQ